MSWNPFNCHIIMLGHRLKIYSKYIINFSPPNLINSTTRDVIKALINMTVKNCGIFYLFQWNYYFQNLLNLLRFDYVLDIAKSSYISFVLFINFSIIFKNQINYVITFFLNSHTGFSYPIGRDLNTLFVCRLHNSVWSTFIPQILK